MKNIQPFKIEKSKTITFIGEILVDEIYNEKDNLTIKVFGGSPANIAINLHDLGIENIRLFGTIGRDENADIILNKLKTKGISIQNILQSNHKTSIVKINKTTGTPKANFLRDADYHIEYSPELEKAIIESAIIHFSYWPLSNEPGKSMILKVIETAKKHGTLIGFDPNYHPYLEMDGAISHKDFLELMKDVNITKPSIDDIRRIFGNHSDDDLFNRYNEIGNDLVVVSKGKEGLLCRYKGVTYIYPTLAKRVVDATGAGDAFYAGMYYAILNNKPLDEILFAGSLCSAYSLKVVGSISDLPKYEILRESF
jgi:fructokinase